VSDYDSPWKEALEHFFPAFLQFFFPRVHELVDWERGYESLDKELQQVVREAAVGKRLADKLFQVWLKDGQEAWVLVHIEVQSQPEEEFAERMYVYNYRLYDRYRRPVISLAVLGDEDAAWRPDQFGYELGGCRVGIEFPVVKLLDYSGNLADLETDPNPFAAVVLAHLKTMQTRQDAAARQVWKLRVIKGLYERGLDRKSIIELFRLIDWMMDLPKELEERFIMELTQFEEVKKMPYVTNVERMAQERGEERGRREGEERGRRETLLETIATGLEARFGPEGLELLTAVQQVQDIGVLRALHKAMWTGATLDDLRRLIP